MDTEALEITAAGKMTEALESLQRARGHLYSFHQLVGKSDLALDAVVDLLNGSGHPELADAIERDLLGRNVIAGRWTFQIIEDFEDGYWAAFAEHEARVRNELTGGERHVYEAQMKARRRTPGRAGHESTPADLPDS